MQLTDTKKVNIYPRKAIVTTNPPIRSPMRGVVRTIKDIRRCITSGAKVEEVFPGGGKVLLNIHNYDLDNSDKAVVLKRPAGKKIEQPASPRVDVPSMKPEEPPKVEPPQIATLGYIQPIDQTPESQPTVTTTAQEGDEPMVISMNSHDQPKKAESENPATPVNPNRYAEEINTNYSRRQRRAMARAQAEKEAQAVEESVTVTDPE